MKKLDRRTVGILNKTTDLVLHPLAKGKAKVPIIIIDSLLHATIERDPQASLRKFAQYSLVPLLDEVNKLIRGLS